MSFFDFITDFDEPIHLCSKHTSFHGDIECPLDIWDDIRTIDDILLTINTKTNKITKEEFLQNNECTQLDIWRERKRIFGEAFGTTIEKYLSEGEVVIESGITYVIEAVHRCRITYVKDVNVDPADVLSAYEKVTKSVGHGSEVWVNDYLDDADFKLPHSTINTTIDCIVTTPYLITAKTIRRAQDAYFKVRRQMIEKLKIVCGTYNTDVTQVYLEIREAGSNRIVWSVGSKPKK